VTRDAIAWTAILVDLGVRPQTAGRWADAFAEVLVNSDDEAIAFFLGQILHESGMLEHVEENLRYSADRLVAVWPHRFPTVEAARPYSYNAPALAEKVYQGRLGNTEPGDGYKYRGRGPIQVTGRANYAALEEQTGLPLVANPDLLTQPRAGLMAAAVWFGHNAAQHIPDGVEAVTRAVNGGVNGLAQRKALTERALEKLTES
jgi:putative chitinase